MNEEFGALRPVEKMLFIGATLAGLISLFGVLLFGAPAVGSGVGDGPGSGASDDVGAGPLFAIGAALLIVAAVGAPFIAARTRLLAGAVLTVVSALVAMRLLGTLPPTGVGRGTEHVAPGGVFWWQLFGAWLLAWAAVEQLAAVRTRQRALRATLALSVPVLFGAWLLLLWECMVRGLDVPQVLLPAPSVIAERFVTSPSILWADFQQTFLKSVLVGWALGCGAGFLVALAIDRSPFLQRGLLPIGNLASALPIVGLAPIMVMWFGFDWPSKVAVVVVMTFFPMLVNTIAGLAATQPMQRDLMRTWGADYTQTLWRLRLPAAMPFVFNALKINSTLALIGAIVAEFFGTPIVGMGFRISTEVGRMNVDMVWAEIAVAAVAGSTFYGLLALIERRITHWHPSMRVRAVG